LLSYVVLPSEIDGFTQHIEDALSNTTFVASIYPRLLELFRAEAQLPQRVSVMPFPTTAFTFNPFFTFTADVRARAAQVLLWFCAWNTRLLADCGQVFSFLFSFSFLYPASRLLRDVVREKEMKLREGMKAMGLGSGALLTSWYLTYALFTLFQAGIITLVTMGNIFKHSDPGIVFGLFYLFGLSTMASCMLVSRLLWRCS
jgi:ABC-2 family transporter protein